MALIDAPAAAWEPFDRFDREALAVQWAVARARRNPWFGGDILSPEFGPALSAIVAARPVDHGLDLPADPARGDRPNSWAGDARRQD